MPNKKPKYPSKDPKKRREYNIRFYNTERGFFSMMYSDLKKSKKHNSFKNFEDFFDHWLDQKKAWGWKCPATGITMTTIKYKNAGKRGKDVKHTTVPTNVSRDRILPSMGYSRKNLIFTCWQYNNDKSSFSPQQAMSFLRIVRDRYGGEFLKNIEKINKEICILYEKINKKKNNKSYTKYIINGLQELVNIKRKQLFTEVYEKNYFISNFDYSKDNYKIINKIITYNIDNIYINLSNILNNDNINNIEKLIFIYNCLNIYSNNKVLYLCDKYKIV